MAGQLRIALAQINAFVGDIAGNTDRIVEAIRLARQRGRADLVVFPELAISGYPPEDLLFHAGFRRQLDIALDRIGTETAGIAALVGFPEFDGDRIYNAAAIFVDGGKTAVYRKQCLPNYSVFDEQRYFTAGTSPVVVTIRNVPVGVAICEDIWEQEPCRQAAGAGARMIVAINGSPYELGRQQQRERVLKERAGETGLPIVYQNLVGGQDELVFDGGSCVVNAEGAVVMRAPAFTEGIYDCSFAFGDDSVVPLTGDISPLLSDDASIYTALVTGVRDYVRKNGFPGVVLGLSGGLDSALTLAIAVDALGAGSVQAVMMAYRYTSKMSLEDAEQQALAEGVGFQVIPIDATVGAINATLADLFAGLAEDSTEENIQARCRGIILMAISNKTGRMVLTTGNKSEMAVGYATLYGDMVGGFAPLKDCTKTRVYRLARYRNSIGPVIPDRVIERPPSAELRPDQKDSDSLPDYAILDAILDALMIENCSVDEIAARGFDRRIVGEVLDMVRHNEYKRRQAPPGVRVSGRAFGRDWRYPLTSGYRHPEKWARR